MKKILSMSLALLMMLALLLGAVACTETPDEPGTNNSGSTGSGTTDNNGSDNTNQPTNERIPTDYLPNTQYGEEGAPASYNILEWSVSGAVVGDSWVPWEEGDVDELDGDILGEAVCARNAAVEERYNVEITAEYASYNTTPNISTLMNTNHTSGEDRYQLMTTRAVNLADFVLNGQLLDMNEYDEYLHFDEAWWVPDSIVSYTLGEHLYVASSELLLRDKGATAVIYFNRDLAKDIGMDTALFDLVREGSWTFAEMILACESAAGDANGTTMMDSAEDTWGLASSDDTIYWMYAATGSKFAVVNEDGLLEASFGDNEDTIVLLEEILEDIIFQEDWCYHSTHHESYNPEGIDIFVEGHALFNDEMVKQVSMSLKDMKTAYGILPLPKYDEDQENYASLVWEHHDSVLGIPAAVKNAELCAVILEALSWESYYTVSPDFYEGILLSRGARDADSKEMLQLALDTRVYDPGLYYAENCGLHNENGILRKPTTTWSADIASIWATYGDAFKNALDTVNEIIQDID